MSVLWIVACGYLAAGTATLAAMYIAQRRARRESSQLLERVLAPYKSRRKSVEAILEDYVFPTLTALIVLTVWPVAVGMKIRHVVKEKRRGPWRERAFEVAAADLLEQRPIAQIELAEMIHDPLGAVPAVPFGHLHRGWVELLAKMQPQDELWSFRSRWSGNWGPEEIRTGYVIVRAGAPGAYVLTARFPVEAEDGGERVRGKRSGAR